MPPRTLRLLALPASLALATLAACSSAPRGAAPQNETVTSKRQSAASRAGVAPDIRGVVADVDAALAAGWKRDGVVVAPRVDDATFLRRATLDLTGELPSAEKVKALGSRQASEADEARSDAARAKLLAELTQSGAWARHWTNVFDDLWMTGERLPVVDRIAFRQWLHQELREGTAYDALVREMITASGTNSVGGRPNVADWELSEGSAPPAEVNGAVNWFLQGIRQPQNLAGLASRTFLGVQIQCAECHDHPTESWKQEDFRRFTSAFVRVDGRRADMGRAMGLRRIELSDSGEVTRRMRARMRRTGYGEEAPTALDGTSLEGGDGSPRQALAQWMTAPDNPWFAKAIVNRLWAQFLGRGFVDPVDDFRQKQDVLAPEVMDRLAADFVEHGYDLRRLMRVIASTSAYGRAATPSATGDDASSARLWERFTMRPMNDTQLLDALVTATGTEPVLEEVAGERLPRLKVNLRRRFRFTFDVDETSSDDGFTGTVPQALMLLNGAVAGAGATALDGSTVGQAARLPGGPEATIAALYRAALSREPSPEELTHWLAYVKETSGEQTEAARPRGGGPVGRVYRRKRLRESPTGGRGLRGHHVGAPQQQRVLLHPLSFLIQREDRDDDPFHPPPSLPRGLARGPRSRPRRPWCARRPGADRRAAARRRDLVGRSVDERRREPHRHLRSQEGQGRRPVQGHQDQDAGGSKSASTCRKSRPRPTSSPSCAASPARRETTSARASSATRATFPTPPSPTPPSAPG